MTELEKLSKAYLEALESEERYEINKCYASLVQAYRDVYPDEETLWRSNAKKFARSLLKEKK